MATKVNNLLLKNGSKHNKTFNSFNNKSYLLYNIVVFHKANNIIYASIGKITGKNFSPDY